MLEFIDRPKGIKIIRTAGNGASSRQRTLIGTVSKSTLELNPELRATLSRAEAAEVERVVELYRKADAAQKRARLLQFVQIAREVGEHYRTSAEDSERRLIATAVQTLARQLKQFEGERQDAVELSATAGPAVASKRTPLRAAR